jgi:hypothetical protein
MAEAAPYRTQVFKSPTCQGAHFTPDRQPVAVNVASSLLYFALDNPPKRNGGFVTTKHLTLKERIETVLAYRRKREALRKEILDSLPAALPPVVESLSRRGAGWHGRGFIICPASKGRYTCANHRRRMGADCPKLRALGLRGDRSTLPRRERPMCGARNRQGNPCSVRVELGKRRYRFHGGLSTGPKTAAGRARIAEAQRRRWRKLREAK